MLPVEIEFLTWRKRKLMQEMARGTPAFATARKIAARAKTYLAQNSGGVTKRAPIRENRSRSALSGYPLAALTQALLEASTKMAANDQRNQRNNMQRNGNQQNPGRQTNMNFQKHLRG